MSVTTVWRSAIPGVDCGAGRAYTFRNVKRKTQHRELHFLLNGKNVRTCLPGGMAVLDFLRREQRLTGTKEGCREGDCGACTVLLGELRGDDVLYRAVTSCLMPLAELEGRHIVTIEGLASTGEMTPVQRIMVEEGGTQCGFCTPGFVMSMTGFFLSADELSEEELLVAIEGNLCRCTGYVSIQRAAARMVTELGDGIRSAACRLDGLIDVGLVPAFFRGAASLLRDIQSSSPPGDTAGEVPLVAGGTDLYVQKGDELADGDVRALLCEEDLRIIARDGDTLIIGGAVTTEEMKQSCLVRDALPGFADDSKLISSQLVRQRASVAGNIVNASPIGDLSIMLLAAGAELVMTSDGRERTVPLRRFFKGYKDIDLYPAELIQSIRVPVCLPSERFHFEKVSRRTYLDIATVNTALRIRVVDDVIEQASLSAGGVGPTPAYLANASAVLVGRAPNRATVQEATRAADEEISPISDVRGSEAYKRLLLRQLIIAHFVDLFPERGFV